MKITPCDIDGFCPYDAEYIRDCEYHCRLSVPDDEEDSFDYEEDSFDYEEED